ncbi:MAG: NUDIX hydrolase [Deltaproteobacteria bacterium]|nr:NUDIX hydrolase [Deltaproteobacteria bacterium]
MNFILPNQRQNEKVKGAFESLIIGRFDSGQISARLTDRIQTLPPELVPGVTARWQQQLRLAQSSGNSLFDGEMLRMDSVLMRQSDDGARFLDVRLSRTQYKTFVGTNLALSSCDFEIPHAHLANPLGLSAVIVSSDSKLMLGKRGKGTFLYSGYWHTFGGMAVMGDVDDGGDVSLFQVVRRELYEELGLTDSEITAQWCLGMVRDRTILQPEMIFEVHVSPDAAALRMRVQSGKARHDDEHDELIAIENSLASVNSFVTANQAAITPVAMAALARCCALANTW